MSTQSTQYSRADDIKTIELESRGFRWKLPRNDVLTKPFLSDEDHEPHLTKFIQEYVHQGDIVMDIGACFGFHTLEMSRCVGPTGKVYAFEPQHEMYDLLNTNLQHNECHNTEVYNVAVGDVVTDVCMYNAYPDEQTNWGDSFISWKYNKDDYNVETDMTQPEMIGKGGQTLPLNKRTVKCQTLDDFVFEQPVKFVKIDVQGFELMVLKGGAEFIRNNRPIMVIEFEDNCMQFHGYTTKELVEYLSEQNYKVLLLDHPYPCDHICIPNEKVYDFFKHFQGKIHPHTTDNPINHNVQHGIDLRLCL
jgi:FkbM family methyltransferase